MQRDLFGQKASVEAPLKDPVELDCEVTALTAHAALLRFLDSEGRPREGGSPRNQLRFRGNGSPRIGAHVVVLGSFKAREVGADAD